MAPHEFHRKLGGAVDVDVCLACQGIWFDEFESLQLAAEGVVSLFRLIAGHADDERRPLAGTLYCPRCDAALASQRDMVRTGHFGYHRCAAHGRFIVFTQFLIEKGFVREVSPAEVRKLSVEIAEIRCSGCGGPVDIRKDVVCPWCHAPIAVLDADAVATALAGYQGSGAGVRAEQLDGDALLQAAGERFRNAATKPAAAPPDLVAHSAAIVLDRVLR